MHSNTFLFPWNPKKWPWPEISEAKELLQQAKKVEEEWHCTSHKKVRKGDRAFLVKVGGSSRGIFGSGFVSSDPFLSNPIKNRYNVLIQLDVLLNPSTDPILTLDLLQIGRLAKQLWTPQSSGIIIKSELVEELEAVWQDFLVSGTDG